MVIIGPEVGRGEIFIDGREEEDNIREIKIIIIDMIKGGEMVDNLLFTSLKIVVDGRDTKILAPIEDIIIEDVGFGGKADIFITEFKIIDF